MSVLIFLDTETTGYTGRLIEVGAIACRNGQMTDDDETFQKYCNPQCPVDFGAYRVHGLSEKFLANKPLFKDVAKDLQEFLRGKNIVIHNSSFDVGVLDREFADCGLPPMKEVAASITCSLKLARKKLFGLESHSLDNLCRHFGVAGNRTYHGALLDARLLAQVYFAMMR